MKIVACLLAIAGFVPIAIHAAEYQRDEEIAPESAEDLHSPMRDSIRNRPAPLRRILGKRLENAPPFWRDAEGRLRFRLYDFERNNGDSTLSLISTSLRRPVGAARTRKSEMRQINGVS